MSDYHKGVLSNIATYIEHANLNQQKILIDPKGQDYQIYKNASLLTPNQKELQAVIGSWQTEAQLHTKAHQLIEHLNLQALLLTRSEQGMTLFYKNQHFDFATQAKEVFDVSGAGDTVIASLAAFWGAGLPLLEAVYLANYAAGIAVSKLGTAPVYLQEFASLFDAN